ncbi:MAG: RnfABCDGE type electron transport complex subunit G [Bacteroidales bacterium]|nr:RnfABCDGE type electron transport complex subunit G [Bacteroidales bacterium]
MAAQSTLRNMVLCLTLVCLVCAAVLGGMYALTYEPIRKANENILKASIGAVLPEGVEIGALESVSSDGGTFEYYPAVKDGEAVAYAVKSTAIGFGGPLSLMVGVLKDGTVFNTSVLSCTETPGLGAKCQESGSHFRTQFQGFGADKVLKVTKDGGDVDAITASTITSRAYALAVSNAVAVAKYLAGSAEAVDTASGASVPEEKKGEE